MGVGIQEGKGEIPGARQPASIISTKGGRGTDDIQGKQEQRVLWGKRKETVPHRPRGDRKMSVGDVGHVWLSGPLKIGGLFCFGSKGDGRRCVLYFLRGETARRSLPLIMDGIGARHLDHVVVQLSLYRYCYCNPIFILARLAFGASCGVLAESACDTN